MPTCVLVRRARALVTTAFLGAVLLGFSGAQVARAEGGTPPVTLSWEASTDEDVAGYKVYSGTRPGEHGKLLAILARDVTTYKVTELQPNTTYYFAVTAIDQSGNESSFSAEVSVSIY